MEFIKQIWNDYGQWADSLWLLAAIALPRNHAHRIYALCYVASCIFMLRLQVEFMFSLNYPSGFLPLLDGFVLWRGMIAYSIIHVGYFIFMQLFPRNRNVMVMATAISLFFAGLTLSTILMVL
jgi:hypothetical protein